MAITASFSAGAGQLSALGDAQGNAMTLGRDAAGRLLVNNGAVPVVGGTPTVANTTKIQAFGQAGTSDIPSVVQPRFQAGVRYRPNEIFSVDVIYGRNISGENANWITLGTTIRFPVPDGKPALERSRHL